MAGGGTLRVWQDMVSRCNNEKHFLFLRFGGRGIRVADRWLDFANFVADMGEKPRGHVLRRFPDSRGNFEPGNCRWVTPAQQQQWADQNNPSTKAEDGRSLLPGSQQKPLLNTGKFSLLEAEDIMRGNDVFLVDELLKEFRERKERASALRQAPGIDHESQRELRETEKLFEEWIHQAKKKRASLNTLRAREELEWSKLKIKETVRALLPDLEYTGGNLDAWKHLLGFAGRLYEVRDGNRVYVGPPTLRPPTGLSEPVKHIDVEFSKVVPSLSPDIDARIEAHRSSMQQAYPNHEITRANAIRSLIMLGLITYEESKGKNANERNNGDQASERVASAACEEGHD